MSFPIASQNQILTFLILPAHPCAGGTSELIRGSFSLGLIAIVFSLCVGCDGSDSNPDDNPAIVVVSPEQRALNRAETLWLNQGITSYQYIYNRFCFCPTQESQVVGVVNNQVVEAFFTPSGVPITGNELDVLPIVEDLFAIVQDAIDDNVDRLDVEYHSELGYPESIFIDGSLSVADDEFTYVALDLQ